MQLFEDYEIYKAKQVAEGIKATEDFVWREIRERRLRAIRFRPNVLRIRGCDINQWIERNLTVTKEEVACE